MAAESEVTEARIADRQTGRFRATTWAFIIFNTVGLGLIGYFVVILLDPCTGDFTQPLPPECSTGKWDAAVLVYLSMTVAALLGMNVFLFLMRFMAKWARRRSEPESRRKPRALLDEGR